MPDSGFVAATTLLDALQSHYTPAQQQALRSARVVVAGCGGLGSNVALHLARAGVGELLLIDFDVVALSNLNRQQYELAEVGLPKVGALAARISRINPYCVVETSRERIDDSNVAELAAYPFVVEAFDAAPSKATLINGLLELPDGPIIVAASGMAGLGAANDITTRRVNRRLYVCGDGRTDVAQTPELLGARVAVCAGHQATTLLRIILGLEP